MPGIAVASPYREEKTMQITRGPERISFRFEKNDWLGGRAKGFLDEFKRQLIKGSYVYDGETRQWTFDREFEGTFDTLRKAFFTNKAQQSLITEVDNINELERNKWRERYLNTFSRETTRTAGVL